MDNIYIFVFGGTGTIGDGIFKIADNNKKIKIVGISFFSNTKKALYLEKKYKLKYLYNAKENNIKNLEEIINDNRIDIFFNAVYGFSGLFYTLKLIKKNKIIALANKESILYGNKLIKRNLRLYKKSRIIPVDSEHSAIMQCIHKRKKYLENIIITASGSKFYKFNLKELKSIKYEEVFKHPIWKMGKEITVNSATLMNKAHELIEAKFLFNLKKNQIKACIHPTSIVHALVEFVDNSILALFSVPDMQLAIQTAIFYPKIEKCPIQKIDFNSYMSLEFYPIDQNRFDAIKMAYEAMGSEILTIILCSINEYYVNEFINKEIYFYQIVPKIRKIFNYFKNNKIKWKITKYIDILKLYNYIKNECRNFK